MDNLEGLSDKDLEAVAAGHLDSLSDQALEIIAGHQDTQPSTESEMGPLRRSWDYLTTEDLSSASDPLALGARLGQFANKGNQDLSGAIAEESGRIGSQIPLIGNAIANQGIAAGTALSTVSQALIPRNRLDVGLYALSPALKAAQSVGEFVRPGINKVGAHMMKSMAGVGDKVGERLMSKPSTLLEAGSKAEAGGAYKTFEGYTGLKGMDQIAGERAKAWSPAELYETALNTANKIKKGIKVSEQELYTASQAENQLKRLAKYGNPDALSMLGANSLTEAGRLADDALGAVYQEYGPLRRAYANASAADKVTSIFPINKDSTTSAARSITAGGTALTALATGHLGGLAALPFFSPAFYGGALRGAAVVGKAADAVAPVYRVMSTTQIGPQANALYSAYQSQR